MLDRLEQLVIKPVDGYGGVGVRRSGRARPTRSSRARAPFSRNTGRWVAQETITLSTHPTSTPGADSSHPRHVDLRMFVYHGAGPVAVPAALTRVAPPGSMIVNSSRGGGAKDTWILTGQITERRADVRLRR